MVYSAIHLLIQQSLSPLITFMATFLHSTLSLLSFLSQTAFDLSDIKNSYAFNINIGLSWLDQFEAWTIYIILKISKSD